MNQYFSGKELYGNDFSLEQIQKWYLEEAEAYSELNDSATSNYKYNYHLINIIHGYKKLQTKNFNNVLGFRSAWGHEFLPIIDKINKLTIIKPSDNMRSKQINGIIPTYIKPNVDGKLDMDDDIFDHITCFGALHHIPNVTFVLKELIRVLKPGGFILIREPIISMGDWRIPRIGLTKNERGIPIQIFKSIFKNSSIKILSKNYYFTASYRIHNIVGKYLKKGLREYRFYIYFDKFISCLLKCNVHYHTTKNSKPSVTCIFLFLANWVIFQQKKYA